jgi:hypothetical protein
MSRPGRCRARGPLERGLRQPDRRRIHGRINSELKDCAVNAYAIPSRFAHLLPYRQGLSHPPNSSLSELLAVSAGQSETHLP